MPRPFRNPDTVDERQANADWLLLQLGHGPAQRDPEWPWHPDAMLDHDGAFFHDLVNDAGDGYPRQPFPQGRGHRRFFPEPGQAGHEEARRGAGAPRLRVRREDEMPRNLEYLKAYPQLNLDKLAEGPVIPRDIRVPPFKVNYDSHEQINTKLCNTVIMVKENPMKVVATIDVGKGKFALLLDTVNGAGRGARAWVNYEDVKDCRGIAPGYVNHNGGAFWLYRAPERQNQQGMNSRNTYYRPAGGTYTHGASHEFLMQALASRKDMEYAPNVETLLETGAMNSIRLSNNVALYKVNKKGVIAGVEYCGRAFGLMVNNRVKVLDENDLRPSWIHKDLRDVGLMVGA